MSTKSPSYYSEPLSSFAQQQPQQLPIVYQVSPRLIQADHPRTPTLDDLMNSFLVPVVGCWNYCEESNVAIGKAMSFGPSILSKQAEGKRHIRT
mmetsp:Transcript_33482/g.49570  ORF Transcript_33482/g.49570 Transcript_33482/m.49570 type:complete len:94 (-) Transcript_33482:84-365(-)